MMFLIGWALLTIPVYLIGASACSCVIEWDSPGVSREAKLGGALLFLPTWWGIYFLIVGAA